jgi:hypothetical protein
MGIVWRGIVVLAVFLCVALTVSHSVMAHEMARPGTPFAEVRLASWMAGLFAGGAAAVVAAIVVLIKRRR